MLPPLPVRLCRCRQRRLPCRDRRARSPSRTPDRPPRRSRQRHLLSSRHTPISTNTISTNSKLIRRSTSIMGPMVMSSTERHRRTQAQRRDTARTAIMETAIELLAAGGYAKLTLADLGERAGYSRSLATHYFGSKRKLLSAVIAYVLSNSPPTLDSDIRDVERI